MTRRQLQQHHTKLTEAARKLMALKNADYGADSDPFKNFRRHGLYGVTVRLSDKLARLDRFIETGVFAVKDEKIEDTIIDIINYAVIFYALLEDERASK